MSSCLAGQGYHVDRLSRRETGFDVTDQGSVAAQLSALVGPYDLIFVAIGVLAAQGRGPEKTLGAIDADAMAQVLAVNTIGPALILGHAARLLRRDGHAVCAVLSARVGSIGDNRLGGWYSYRASKAALNQIVHGAAIELGRSHPDAICVAMHPGTVETAFTAQYTGRDKLAPSDAANRLLAVLDGLVPADSGQFFDQNGAAVPW